MAIALTAWLMAPAPMACTSTLDCWRTTPAMAPATATGLLVAETLRTSTATAAPSDVARGGVGEDVDIIATIVSFCSDRPRPLRCNRYARGFPPAFARFRPLTWRTR